MHTEDFLFGVLMQFFPVRSNVTASSSSSKPKVKFNVYVLLAVKLASLASSHLHNDKFV
jgi:hypothetical protein